MEILQSVLIVIYVLVALGIIILALIQGKDDEGASGAVMGGSGGSSFYEKNKGRTKEGMMKKWTIILAVAFAFLTVGLGIVLMYNA
ncbi:MAG: preprotein translocase subunit SecG [Oscillospiraceae bacterium]|nr:preprotein translocase subunit SecG [Oscillospiraceae bacterium]